MSQDLETTIADVLRGRMATYPFLSRLFRVEVDLNGTPAGKGEGRSKKEAEQSAAKAAIAHLTGAAADG